MGALDPHTAVVLAWLAVAAAVVVAAATALGWLLQPRDGEGGEEP